MRYNLKRDYKICEEYRCLSVNAILLWNHIPINVAIFSIFAQFTSSFIAKRSLDLPLEKVIYLSGPSDIPNR